MLTPPCEAGRSQEIVIAGASRPRNPVLGAATEACALRLAGHREARFCAPLAGPSPRPMSCERPHGPAEPALTRSAARAAAPTGSQPAPGRSAARYGRATTPCTPPRFRTPPSSPGAPSSPHVAFVHLNLQLAHRAGNGVGLGTAGKIGNSLGISRPRGGPSKASRI